MDFKRFHIQYPINNFYSGPKYSITPLDYSVKSYLLSHDIKDRILIVTGNKTNRFALQILHFSPK